MSIDNSRLLFLSIDKQINIAVKSKISGELEILSKSPNMNVRRAVARNRSTSSEVLDVLSEDPTFNVGYMARNNPNFNGPQKSRFDEINDNELHRCILCQLPENNLRCNSC